MKIETQKVTFIECENCGNARSYWLIGDFEEIKKKSFSYTCFQCNQHWKVEVRDDNSVDIIPTENEETRFLLIECPASLSPVGIVISRDETEVEMKKRRLGIPNKRYKVSDVYELESLALKQCDDSNNFIRFRVKEKVNK